MGQYVAGVHAASLGQQIHQQPLQLIGDVRDLGRRGESDLGFGNGDGRLLDA